MRAALVVAVAIVLRSFGWNNFGRRPTADADAIVFVSPSEADSLIRRAVATGVVRCHGERLDVAYLEHTLRPICELAEDMAPWSRLQRVLSALRSPDEHA